MALIVFLEGYIFFSFGHLVERGLEVRGMRWRDGIMRYGARARGWT